VSNLSHREKLLYGALAGEFFAIGFFLLITRVTFTDSYRVAGAAFTSWLVGWSVPTLLSVFYRQTGDAHVDERDHLIELRGIRSAYAVLFVSIAFLFYYLGFISPGTSTSHILTLLFAAWIFSQIAKIERQLEFYRTQDGWLADRVKPLLCKRAIKRMEDLRQKRIEQ